MPRKREVCEECGLSQLYLSWSQLRTWDECRQKAYLSRTKKRATLQDVRGYFHGTVCDLAMRDWLNDPDLPPGQMVERVREIIDAEEKRIKEKGEGVVKWKSATDKETMAQFCETLVTRLEPILMELVIPYDFEPAKRFKTPVTIPYLDGSPASIYLVGEIDILTKDPATSWGIWDLKATADEGYWRKTIMQLVYYDLAVMSMFGERSARAGLIQPMCKNPTPELVVTDDLRAQLMGRIVNLAHSIWRKDYAPREDNKICGMCAYRHACEKFQPVQVAPGRKRMSLVRPTSE